MMTPYASNTGTKRNLEALRKAGWRILLSPLNPKLPPGFRYAIDNGAFSCWQSNLPFDDEGFIRLAASHGPRADFVVIPDKVAAGKESLEFSRLWMPYLLPRIHNLLLAVQDGMTADDVGAFVRHYQCGIFLGGSIEWKLKTLYPWGMVAHALGCYYHVGRVNTAKRIRLCAEAGADSVDGTSATMYACTVPLLDAARKQASLLTPASQEVTA